MDYNAVAAKKDIANNKQKDKDMNYQVDEKGYYGEFGGAYVPEILYATVRNLQEQYLPIIESQAFKDEYPALLKDYV